MLNKMQVLALGVLCAVSMLAANAQAADDAAKAHKPDIAAGKAKVQEVCYACHGLDGISLSPDIPNLKGQKEAYILKAINYYKSGERKNPIMSSVASTISEADAENVAAYFSSLK